MNTKEPRIYVTFTADELARLVEQLDEWDHPIAHRLNSRLSPEKAIVTRRDLIEQAQAE